MNKKERVRAAIHRQPTDHVPSCFSMAIMGGLANRGGVLENGSEEEITREVQQVIRDFGSEGFILGADCTLPTDIELWRIRAAVRAAATI